MALTKKQMELDKAKWINSEELGTDACGTFDYCEKCNKDVENPCDKAYKAFHKKATVKKTETTVKATKTVKKSKQIAKTDKRTQTRFTFSKYKKRDLRFFKLGKGKDYENE